MLNTELSCDPEILFLGIHQRELKACSHNNVCMNVQRSVVHNNKKVETRHQLRNTMCHIHSMEYDSAIERNKVLIHATMWMNFKTLCWKKEDTRLHIVWSHLYEMFRIALMYRDRKLICDSLGPERWRIWEWLLMGFRERVWDENVLKLNVVMVVQLCEWTKNHLIIHFKLVNCAVCELYLSKIAILKKWGGNKSAPEKENMTLKSYPSVMKMAENSSDMFAAVKSKNHSMQI